VRALNVLAALHAGVDALHLGTGEAGLIEVVGRGGVGAVPAEELADLLDRCEAGVAGDIGLKRVVRVVVRDAGGGARAGRRRVAGRVEGIGDGAGSGGQRQGGAIGVASGAGATAGDSGGRGGGG
jgi:hypothetical protein